MTAAPLIFFYLFGILTPQASGEGSQPLSNLLLVSVDSKIVGKVRDQYRYGMPRSEFAQKFGDGRVSLHEWGTRGMVLLDQELPLLVELESRRDLVKVLLEGVGPDWVVRVKDVPGNRRETLVGAIEEFFPRHSRPDGFDMNEAAFGLHLSFNVTLYDNSGRYKTISLPMPPAVAKTRNDALESHLMPQKGRELTREERARLVQEGETRVALLDKVEFHTFGAARSNLVGGLREAANALEKRFAEVEGETKQAAHELMAKVGFGPPIGEIPRGKVTIENLPADIKGRLTEQLTSSWRTLGFLSPEEAEQYLLRAQAAEVTISLGLRRTFSASDKLTGRPSTGMVHNFLLIRP